MPGTSTAQLMRSSAIRTNRCPHQTASTSWLFTSTSEIMRITAPAGIVTGDVARPSTSIAGSAALTLNCLPETLIMVLTMTMITRDGAIYYFLTGGGNVRSPVWPGSPSAISQQLTVK
jgi:hypothetical protein